MHATVHLRYCHHTDPPRESQFTSMDLFRTEYCGVDDFDASSACSNFLPEHRDGAPNQTTYSDKRDLLEGRRGP